MIPSTSEITVVHWIVFVVAITAMLSVDLLVAGRDGRTSSLRHAAFWSALWIGCGLLSGAWLAMMLGTLTPIVLFPHEVFTRIPYAPTLEGQYIIKNLVLISAGIVVGATVRRGGMVAESYRVGGIESGRPPPKELHSSGEGYVAEGGSGS